MFISILLPAFLAIHVSAAPGAKITGCTVSKDKLEAPSGLAAPTAPTARFVGLGVGVQNYTCSAGGTFTNVGAVAELFDISCLPAVAFDEVTDIVFDVWEKAPKQVTAQSIIGALAIFNPPIVLGQHFFITNPITGSGLSPKWDFTSASLKGHPNAFVVGARTGDVVAPNDPSTNIDWLSLSAAQGDLASQIFRVETRGGQPPTSCTPGTPDISVKYVSQYWFFGGSF
ncbi:putative malate dehydrogenase [Panus rudis PR-1116 ss-1]|nr:putative malate dehydrogenase [Panus rudis PR-1116 ss-1]